MIVDGTLDVTGEVNAGILAPGAYNVGIKYTGGTGEFKLVQANGSDFSTAIEDRGYIVMASTTAGRFVKLAITDATHLFIDDAGSSDIVGEEFGTTAGVAWGSTRPFYIYAVNADDTDTNLKFAISPCPVATQSFVTAKLGYHNNPAATPSDSSMFFLTATNITTSHDQVPCLRIGCLVMTKSALDDWTVSTLTTQHGIGRSLQGAQFTMPTGQMGATSGKYMLANGGTAPVFSSNTYSYSLDPNTGLCTCYVDLANDGGTDGAGAVNSRLALPYVDNSGVDNDYCGQGSLSYTAGPIVSTFVFNSFNGQSYANIEVTGTSATAAVYVNNADWPNGATRYLIGVAEYKAFNE